MTLKNSFLASLKENNKRRIWLWIVSLFGFLLLLPSAVMMVISQHKNNMDYYLETFGETVGEQMVRSNLLADLKRMLDIGNSDVWIFAAAFAIISGVQGFSYLYNRRKIDFYMGMPIKRKKRFLVIWLNGVLVYAIPCLLGVIVTGLVLAGNGLLSGEMVLCVWRTYGILLCLYLGVYHLVILAVMLTGNIIITGFAIGVLFLYECIVRLVIMGYMELFFKFYSYRGYSTNPILSPFAILLNYQNAYRESQGNAWLTAGYLLLFAAVSGIIAYACYLKRPAEAAGKAIAFSKPKPVLKIMMAVPVALLTAILTADVVGYDPRIGKENCNVLIFVMAIAVIFTCCLMQVIYEFDIKGMLHKKHHILISAALVAVVFLVFRFDVLGYDKYIPEARKVESAAIAVPMDGYAYYGNEYWNDDYNYMSNEEYVEEYMYLTDVGAVNQLMKVSMDLVGSYDNLQQLYEDTDGIFRRITVTYRMADKRQVHREMIVNLADAETVELLDRIEASEEYISGAYMGTSDILGEALSDEKQKVTMFYGNGTYQFKLNRQEAKELLTEYKKDIVDSSFKKHKDSVPMGSLCIGIEKQYGHYSSYAQSEVKLYPFYENCTAYLKEKGYYMEHYVNIEDVERIQVINHHYDLEQEAQKQMQEEMEITMEATAEAVYSYEEKEFGKFQRMVRYEEKEDMQAVLEEIYPQNYIYDTWHGNRDYDENYSIRVYFKPDSEVGKDMEGYAEYSFRAGEVPDFVEADTAYVE